MISQKHLVKYKGIYQKQYGKDISDSEALEQVINLVRLFEILLKVDRRNKAKS